MTSGDPFHLGGVPVDLDDVAEGLFRQASGGTTFPADPTPYLPPIDEIAPTAPPGQVTPSGSPPGSDGFYYFLREPTRPGPGAVGPSRPSPESLPAGPHDRLGLPGSEVNNAMTGYLAEGQDPSFVSLDLVGLRPGGREVPLAPPRGSGPPSGGAGTSTVNADRSDLPGDPSRGGSWSTAPGEPLRGTGGSTNARRGPKIRDDFPILQTEVNGHRLVWLDSGATTQKPACVIDGEAEYYRKTNSNVHRGAHALAKAATDAYEHARRTVQRFLGAASSDEIVFARGATEAINLVAQSWGRQNVRAGDEIVVTHLEHHSNIVPWQMLCDAVGATLRVAPVDDRGEVDFGGFEGLLGPKTRLVAMTHVSNVLGTLVPVAPLAALAHRYGAVVLVDGAQAVAHVPVDVACLGVDFYVFSGHKIYAPTGIGALYGRKELLDAMPPWQGGGSMITDVTFERSVYAPAPAKFEAGTGNIAGAVALGYALDYLERLGRVDVAAHEEALVRYAVERLSAVPGLRMLGQPRVRVGALPFLLEGRDPVSVARALDRRGIAVRAGHHCAQPILRRFGLEASVRASLGVYNDEEDVDLLVDALLEIARSRGP